MTDRDVLICGCCCSQFSDLKIFIDHKQNCGNVITSLANNNEVCSIISPSQQATHFGSQQIVIPSQGHSSIVSLPVGMPHVFLQTSSGLSQMYRIVLEPSLNTTTQISPSIQVSQPSHVSNTIQHANNNVVETEYSISGVEKNHSAKETQESHSVTRKQEMDVKGINLESSSSMNEPSMIRLTSMNPIDTSWSTPRTEHRSSSFETLDDNVIPEKNVLDSDSTSANLHTEEEVATFLATQLVSQSTPNQHSKIRDSNPSVPKYNIVIEDPSANQLNMNFMDGNQKVNNSVEEKNDVNTLKVEKHIGKPSPHKGTFENSQSREGNEILDKATKKILCSFEDCKFSTIHKKDMIRHVRKHTGEKPFQCPECGLRLSRQDKLKVHLRTHSKERPYACIEPGCSYRANEKAHLKKHIRTHTNERPFRCQFCPYGARDGSHLTVHLRSHTGDAPFHCQVDGCSATFKTSSDMKRHEKLHTGEKPFKCAECDYASALKANLRVHIRINHSKGDKFACKSCPFIANSRKQLKEHEVTHVCPPYFGQPAYEVKLKRNEAMEINSFPTNSKQPHLTDSMGKKIGFSKGRRGAKPFCPKNFNCDKCGSGFVREDSFRSHVRQHERKKMEQGKTTFFPLKDGVQKGKMKSVYTLNYILQGNTDISRVNFDLKERDPLPTDALLSRNGSINIAQEQNPQEASSSSSGTTNEAFSTYMITIDGIPSMYSSTNALSKDAQPLETHSLNQEDPVVHILSSPSISHSLHPPDSINEPSTTKVVTIEERNIDNLEQNIT